MSETWLAYTHNFIHIYRIAGDQSLIVYDCRTYDIIFETYSKCQVTYITLIDVLFSFGCSRKQFVWKSSIPFCHPWDLVYIGYPSQMHLKLNYREISFACNLFLNGFKSFSNFAQSTAVSLPWKSNISEKLFYVLDEWVFMRFEFKISSGRIQWFTQGPKYGPIYPHHHTIT